MRSQPPQKASTDSSELDLDPADEAAALALSGVDAAAAKPKRRRAKDIEPAARVIQSYVMCTVTRRGRDKIATGNHYGGDGDEFFAEGESIVLPEDIAKGLAYGLDRNGEEKAYLDIVGESSFAEFSKQQTALSDELKAATNA